MGELGKTLKKVFHIKARGDIIHGIYRESVYSVTHRITSFAGMVRGYRASFPLPRE
jgi:hypothetical protein